jgi:uncharacterized damage-inducible protein DinB
VVGESRRLDTGALSNFPNRTQLRRLGKVDPFAQYLLAQAYNNAWSNHRLLSACAQLTQAEYEAKRFSFFPSIKATLNHILTVDWFYIDTMQRSLAGQPVNEKARGFFDPPEPYATCAVLREEQSTSDRELIDICKGLDPEILRRDITVPRLKGPTLEPLPRLLAHVFLHQAHHRGQVHSMLSGTKVAPPQLDDFFCANDAPLRVADFEVLGFDEAAIWPPAE